MKESMKSAEELMTELAEMRQKVAKLETALAERTREADALRASESRYRELFNKNMSAQKQTEQVLRESEERFRSYVENAPHGIFVADEHGNYLEVNHAAEQISGYSRRELLAMNLIDLIPAEDHSKAEEHFKLVVATGKARGEFAYTRKDGSLRYWTVDAVKLSDTRFLGFVTDITEREHAKKALLESEERWQFALEGAGDGVWDWDAQTNHVFFSRQWKTMLGFEEHEIGNTLEEWDRRVHPEDRDDVYTKIQAHFSGETPIYRSEHRIQCKDGSYKWILDRGKVIRWTENKQPLRVIGTHSDITERRYVEVALRREKERAQQYLDIAGVAIIALDREGRITSINQRGLHLLGYNEAELLGKNWFYNCLPERLRESVYAVFKQLMAGEVGPVEYYENPVITKDGRERIVAWHNSLLVDENGRATGILSSGEDINERKQMEEALRESEEKLKTLFAAMTEIVVLHEMIYDDRGNAVDYRITDCNPTFNTVTGIPRDAAVGRLATEIYQAEHAPYLEEYRRVAETGEPHEFTVYYPPMDKHFMISAVSPRTGHFATVITDITAIKQIQEVISAKNNELENYLYVASHDLRAPLVNIQGFSQRLQKQTKAIETLLAEHPFEESEKQQQLDQLTEKGIPKSLDFIFTNVAKMDTLINGLLKISRTGKVKMSIQKINMAALLEKIVRAFSFQLEKVGGSIVFEELPDCYGDEALLDQLFSNIIGNALKYRETNRQVLITISAQMQYKKVLYRVRDTGIGIAQRHLEKIWDVFYQIDSQSSEAGEGIGLSIVKRIVDKHKGKVWVESEEGEGSVFYVELPGYEFSE